MNQSIDSMLDAGGARYEQARQMIENTIGDRVYTRENHGGVSCESGLPLDVTIEKVRAAGKQVILQSGDCDKSWGEYLFTNGSGSQQQSGSGSFIAKQAPDNCGVAANTATKWTRIYEDATLVGRVATNTARLHNADEVAEMAKCGINMPSLDYIHPNDPRMQAFVWGWDEDQPAATGDCAILNDTGRIETTDCAALPQLKACLSSAGNWSAEIDCGAATFAVPANGQEMYQLVQAANGATVALNYKKVAGTWGVPSVGLATLTMDDVAVDEGLPLVFVPKLDQPAAEAIELTYELQHWSSNARDFSPVADDGERFHVSFAKGATTGSVVSLASANDPELERYDYFTLNVVDYTGPVLLERKFAVGTIQNDDEVAGGDPAYDCSAGDVNVTLDSAIPEADGGVAAVHVRVFHPNFDADGNPFDCADVGKYPIVMAGSGWPGGAVASGNSELLNAGIAVASIAPRGFGNAGGTVMVMDPDFEGQDYLRGLDWMEKKLGWAKRIEGTDHLMLGGTGVSYGGGFQLLIVGVDTKNRMIAPVPSETWSNLDYSLNPGGVTKTFVASLLSATGLGSFDPYVNDVIAASVIENEMPKSGRDFFSYHGLDYFCRADTSLRGGDNPETIYSALADHDSLRDFPLVGMGNSGFQVGTPPRQLPLTNALFIQGIRDQLFNFNEAATNYSCLKHLGGDVRLIAGQVSSHMAFGGDAAGLVVNGLDYVNFPIGVDCGTNTASEVTLNWFKKYLLGDETVGEVVTDYDGNKVDVCMANSAEGMFDFVGGNENANFFDDVPAGGAESTVGLSINNIELAVPVITGPAGLNPTIVPIQVAERIDDGSVLKTTHIAGIATAELEVTLPGGLTPSAKGPASAVTPNGPASMDAIIFVGIGHHRPENPGVWNLMEDQLMPVRGLGKHKLDLVGVAERLQPGDQIALLLYGAHPQFPISMSRDPATSVVMVSGEVELPLHEGDDSAIQFPPSAGQ